MDLSVAWSTLQRLLTTAIAMLPRLAIAILLFAVALLVGRVVRALVRRGAARRREHGNLQLALGRLAMAGIVTLGALLAATIAFPNFTPADLIGVLGIGSVAIGFAFKDILQNFLAGILILVTKPFRIGDQIVFKSYEGDVEEIQLRATYLRTYDGRRVVLPNGELFTNSVVVNTAFAKRRMEYDLAIGYDADLELARRVVLEVLASTEGVEPDPRADVIVVGLSEAAVHLRARWWSQSRIADVLVAQDRVLTEVKRRFEASGVELPMPTQRVLLDGSTGGSHSSSLTADGS
ncbi:MAG TPA: mechanosensitive ion channel family protein [Gemmatimonadaceae bacterium]|nr:mechanosensitive ion channel family protein [Gemmatimonadaceae bacterium]